MALAGTNATDVPFGLLKQALAASGEVTDEAGAIGGIGHRPKLVAEKAAISKSYPAISPSPRVFCGKAMKIRIGQGYDVHRLAEGRKLILGGSKFPRQGTCWAILMRDSLLRLTDALLGPPGWAHRPPFPDTDPRFAGVDSRELLREAVRRVRASGWQPRQCRRHRHRPGAQTGGLRPGHGRHDRARTWGLRRGGQ